MKRNRKLLALALAALTAAASLTACAGDQSGESSAAPSGEETSAVSSEESHDPVTVTTNLSDGELSKDQIAQFKEKYPWITVELQKLDDAKMAAALATGTAPDCIRGTGVFELPSYAIKGIAADITDRIEKSEVIRKDDLLPVTNVCRFDGTTIGKGPYYGLPKDWSNDTALFYNKKCFDAAGVPVPDSKTALTWPQVFELAKKLTVVKDKKVVQYGLSATEWGKTDANFNQMLQYVASAGAAISSADNKTMNFDIPAVRDYLTLWADAAKNNVGPNAVNNDQTPGGDLFLANKSALLIDGYWYGGVIRGNDNAKTHLDDFGMLPTPTAPNGKRVAAPSSAVSLMLYKQSKNPDDAWKFLEWYIGGSPADERAKAGWGLPIFKSKMAEIPQETDFDKELLAVVNDESAAMESFLPVNPYLANGGWNIFDKYYQPLVFGKTTVDNMVKNMTKDANDTVTEAVNSISK